MYPAEGAKHQEWLAACKYYKSHNAHRQRVIDILDEDGTLICVGVA